MSTGKWLLILCCFALTIPAIAQNTEGDQLTLIALEKSWNQAQLTHDSRALKAMISDRFVNTEWDGAVTRRDQFLADISDPKFDPSIMSVDDIKVEFHGSTAIVVGSYHTKGKYNGKPYDHLGRFTDTWVRQPDGWKCVASHTSLLQK